MAKRIKNDRRFLCFKMACAKKCPLHQVLRKVIDRIGIGDSEDARSQILNHFEFTHFRGCDISVDLQIMMLEFGILSVDSLKDVDVQECFLMRIVSEFLVKMGVTESELLAEKICPQQMLFLKIMEGFKLLEHVGNPHSSAPWPLHENLKQVMEDFGLI
jgi:hypothetical protein